jgi:hypothetical protein
MGETLTPAGALNFWATRGTGMGEGEQAQTFFKTLTECRGVLFLACRPAASITTLHQRLPNLQRLLCKLWYCA